MRRRPPDKRTPPRGNGTAQNQRAEQPVSSNEAAAEQGAAIDWSQHFSSIHDGRDCCGHILTTARGFHAVDADDNSLGIYPRREDARQAVVAAARARGGMNAGVRGAMIGQASCLAESAARQLFGVTLRLHEAGLEPSEDVVAIVEDVADLSAALLQLADDFAAASARAAAA